MFLLLFCVPNIRNHQDSLAKAAGINAWLNQAKVLHIEVFLLTKIKSYCLTRELINANCFHLGQSSALSSHDKVVWTLFGKSVLYLFYFWENEMQSCVLYSRSLYYVFMSFSLLLAIENWALLFSGRPEIIILNFQEHWKLAFIFLVSFPRVKCHAHSQLKAYCIFFMIDWSACFFELF